ncbi:zinc finger 2-like [Solea senegalensis]|nr:zinc finger 2-like [Solea senegalensis]
MSKADILRQFVAQSLAAASQEILAVVERTVSEYEEEAAGFREQIDRQRKQLELLQPRVKLETLSNITITDVRSVTKRSRRHSEEEEGGGDEDLEDVNNQTPSRRPCEQNVVDAQDHVDLRIHVLENPQTEALSKNVHKKCPRGLQEVDVLELLRSDRGRLELNSVTAEEIQRRGTSTVFIRPKVQKETEDSEEDAGDSSSPTCDTRQQISSRLQAEDVLTGSSTSQQEDDDNMLTEEANDGERQDEEAAAAQRKEVEEEEDDNDEKEEDREKLKDSDDEWEPDMSEEEEESSDGDGDGDGEPKTTNKQNVKCSSVTEVGAKNAAACNACGTPREYADDAGSVCGVCGERPASTETPDLQIQSRLETGNCHICGETFFSVYGRDEHVAAHSGERPHKCNVCAAAFALRASLEKHRTLHVEGKPHTCFTCHKVCEHREALKAHLKTHVIKKKKHLCGVCGKSLSDYRS